MNHISTETSSDEWPQSARRASLPEELFDAFFSDESAGFRDPAAPKTGDTVRIRLRAESHSCKAASLLSSAQRASVPFIKTASDETFDWYEAHITCPATILHYRILIHTDYGSLIYRKDGCHLLEDGSELDERFDFRIIPNYHVPAWAQGAIMYQIMPDRFCNADSTNDVRSSEYAYNYEHVRKIDDWNAHPANDDYRCFYGGDLQGVIDKLDYLQSLGVEAIYFNPLFVSPSSHGYDTQDYAHIDPHFGFIVDDCDVVLADGDTNNRNAQSYIRRTTSRANLDASDKLFAQLCGELHARGMRIILDGVFNHIGSFSAWMDREGIYAQVRAQDGTEGGAQDDAESETRDIAENDAQTYAQGFGAYHNEASPYRSCFAFDAAFEQGYEAWNDFATLPKLNYEHCAHLADTIIELVSKWLRPPYSIDGWRLDVAADLGHTEAYNHHFWQLFRTKLRQVNPDLLIFAEHYGDPSAWLLGNEWDSVMNYDAFMEPLSYFLCGMEKHSDAFSEELYQDGHAFWRSMHTNMACFSWPSLLSAVNELSNHDHSRFLTRTNRRVGRTEYAGSEAASHNIDKRVFREAVVVQMTWPGAPTIYYGDEAGQTGWTDPDCRRSFPWGHEDWSLIELHRTLARLRAEHSCLRSGSFLPLGGGNGWIAFGRFDANGWLATLVNNADYAQDISVRLKGLGVADGSSLASCFETTPDGFVTSFRMLGDLENSLLHVHMPPKSAWIIGPAK